MEAYQDVYCFQGTLLGGASFTELGAQKARIQVRDRSEKRTPARNQKDAFTGSLAQSSGTCSSMEPAQAGAKLDSSAMTGPALRLSKS